MEENCPFCELPKKKRNYNFASIIPKDIFKYSRYIIYSGDYFSVIPDISPIDKYHLLIIPTNHITSFKTIPKNYIRELKKIKLAIKELYIQLTNKEVIYFEHGMCTTDGSACITHAHLHCLPISQDKLNKLKARMTSLLGDSEEVLDDENYLYVETSKEKYLWSDNISEKQFLRKHLAKCLGNKNRITWQKGLTFPEEIQKTSYWLDDTVKQFKLKL